VRSDQVTQVRGYADQLLRVKANPFDPSNRRISILVKNQEAMPQALKAAAPMSVSTPGTKDEHAAKK
jgi:chemotaxis protein MotB